MRTRTKRHLFLNLESLEGKNAPSGGLASGLHHLAENRHDHGHHHAQVGQVRAGQDTLPRHSGQDEAPGHEAANANNPPGHGGLDDGVNHDVGDDNNHNRHGKG